MGRRPSPLDTLTDSDRLTAKLRTLSDVELSQVKELICDLEASRQPHTQPELFDDDLLSTLASAPENQRARQVYAWEQIRRQALRRAAFPYVS